MKVSRILLSILLASAVVCSCSQGAKINGSVKDAPDTKLTLRLLDGSNLVLLDTVKTNSFGQFSYKVKVEKGQPEFVYLYNGDDKIGSMLLQRGENVRLSTDLRGNCSVEGSAESVKLLEVERDEAEFANAFAAANARLRDLDPNGSVAAEVRRDMTKQYIAYYRSRVQYVMNNYHSLTVIPVLYQQFGENGSPVFGQATDAIHFRNCCDSLQSVYPNSKYVKALAEEATRRENIMQLSVRIGDSNEISYPDITLPDIRGERVSLSSAVDGSKLTVIYFWAAEDTGQKMFNFETMKPLYSQYHSKGLEIYAISLDTDKTLWATTVRTLGLDWINVCDGRGAASPAVGTFNVGSIPTVYFIKNGSMIYEPSVKDAETLRRYISSQL